MIVRIQHTKSGRSITKKRQCGQIRPHANRMPKRQQSATFLPATNALHKITDKADLFTVFPPCSGRCPWQLDGRCPTAYPEQPTGSNNNPSSHRNSSAIMRPSDCPPMPDFSSGRGPFDKPPSRPMLLPSNRPAQVIKWWYRLLAYSKKRLSTTGRLLWHGKPCDSNTQISDLLTI